MPVPSPLDSSNLTVKLSIIINGKKVPDTYDILSVTVDHSINNIPSAQIVIMDTDSDNRTFLISNSDCFIPGNEVEIGAAYGDDAETSIFKGIIVYQSVSGMVPDNSVLTVSCMHKAIQMTYVRKEEAYASLKDSDIMAAIIGRYGITATIKNSRVMQELVFQKLATDWDFILSRADFYGYVVTLDGDAITIGEPNISGTPVLRMVYGESMLSFVATLNAQGQAINVSASAWDIQNQALVTANASEPTVNAQGNISAKQLSGALNYDSVNLKSGTPMAPDELQAWADGTLLKMRLSSITGAVSFYGNTLVKPGTLIELAGVGDRYNGSAFVTSVTHSIANNGWTTSVGFGLDKTLFTEKANVSSLPAAGQLPAIHGLQVAIVKQIANDPQNEFRILVTLPTNPYNQTGIWARMSTFYASSGVGASFCPEIGDEVILGFLESNPCYPVILGSMYSSNRPNPITPGENNSIKSITTKTKLTVSFDDEHKIINIQTPGGNSFTLNDDTKSIAIADQNGNTIQMTPSGIDISSDKEINISAKGNINLTATGKLDLNAMQDAKISGLNVTHTAQAAFTAKGTTTAELSASGHTTVKGGIVMIN